VAATFSPGTFGDGMFARAPAPTYAGARRLDERLVRAAVAWSLRPATSFEQAADDLVALAGGNRSALELAIRRVRGSGIRSPEAAEVDTTGGRAAAVLRLALARGNWAW
jgi:hypothetical protein